MLRSKSFFISLTTLLLFSTQALTNKTKDEASKSNLKPSIPIEAEILVNAIQTVMQEKPQLSDVATVVQLALEVLGINEQNAQKVEHESILKTILQLLSLSRWPSAWSSGSSPHLNDRFVLQLLSEALKKVGEKMQNIKMKLIINLIAQVPVMKNAEVKIKLPNSQERHVMNLLFKFLTGPSSKPSSLIRALSEIVKLLKSSPSIQVLDKNVIDILIVAVNKNQKIRQKAVIIKKLARFNSETLTLQYRIDLIQSIIKRLQARRAVLRSLAKSSEQKKSPQPINPLQVLVRHLYTPKKDHTEGTIKQDVVQYLCYLAGFYEGNANLPNNLKVLNKILDSMNETSWPNPWPGYPQPRNYSLIGVLEYSLNDIKAVSEKTAQAIKEMLNFMGFNTSSLTADDYDSYKALNEILKTKDDIISPSSSLIASLTNKISRVNENDVIDVDPILPEIAIRALEKNNKTPSKEEAIKFLKNILDVLHRKRLKKEKLGDLYKDLINLANNHLSNSDEDQKTLQKIKDILSKYQPHLLPQLKEQGGLPEMVGYLSKLLLGLLNSMRDKRVALGNALAQSIMRLIELLNMKDPLDQDLLKKFIEALKEANNIEELSAILKELINRLTPKPPQLYPPLPYTDDLINNLLELLRAMRSQQVPPEKLHEILNWVTKNFPIDRRIDRNIDGIINAIISEVMKQLSRYGDMLNTTLKDILKALIDKLKSEKQLPSAIPEGKRAKKALEEILNKLKSQELPGKDLKDIVSLMKNLFPDDKRTDQGINKLVDNIIKEVLKQLKNRHNLDRDILEPILAAMIDIFKKQVPPVSDNKDKDKDKDKKDTNNINDPLRDIRDRFKDINKIGDSDRDFDPLIQDFKKLKELMTKPDGSIENAFDNSILAAILKSFIDRFTAKKSPGEIIHGALGEVLKGFETNSLSGAKLDNLINNLNNLRVNPNTADGINRDILNKLLNNLKSGSLNKNTLGDLIRELKSAPNRNEDSKIIGDLLESMNNNHLNPNKLKDLMDWWKHGERPTLKDPREQNRNTLQDVLNAFKDIASSLPSHLQQLVKDLSKIYPDDPNSKYGLDNDTLRNIIGILDSNMDDPIKRDVLDKIMRDIKDGTLKPAVLRDYLNKLRGKDDSASDLTNNEILSKIFNGLKPIPTLPPNIRDTINSITQNYVNNPANKIDNPLRDAILDDILSKLPSELRQQPGQQPGNNVADVLKSIVDAAKSKQLTPDKLSGLVDKLKKVAPTQKIPNNKLLDDILKSLGSNPNIPDTVKQKINQYSKLYLGDPNIAEELRDDVITAICNDIKSQLPQHLRTPPNYNPYDALNTLIDAKRSDTLNPQLLKNILDQLRGAQSPIGSQKPTNNEILSKIFDGLKNIPNLPSNIRDPIKSIKRDYLNNPANKIDDPLRDAILDDILSKLPSELRQQPGQQPGNNVADVLKSIVDAAKSNQLTPDKLSSMVDKLKKVAPTQTIPNNILLDNILKSLGSNPKIPDTIKQNLNQFYNVYLRDPNIAQELKDEVINAICNDIRLQLPQHLRTPPNHNPYDALHTLIQAKKSDSLNPQLLQNILDQLRGSQPSTGSQKPTNNEILSKIFDGLKKIPNLQPNIRDTIDSIMQNYINNPANKLDDPIRDAILDDILSKLPSELRPQPGQQPGQQPGYNVADILKSIADAAKTKQLTQDKLANMTDKLKELAITKPPNSKILGDTLKALQSNTAIPRDLQQTVKYYDDLYLQDPNIAKELTNHTVESILDDLIKKLPPELRNPPGDSIHDALSSLNNLLKNKTLTPEKLKNITNKLKQPVEQMSLKDILGAIIGALQSNPTLPPNLQNQIEDTIKHYMGNPHIENNLDPATLQKIIDALKYHLPNDSDKLDILNSIGNAVKSDSVPPNKLRDLINQLKPPYQHERPINADVLERILKRLISALRSKLRPDNKNILKPIVDGLMQYPSLPRNLHDLLKVTNRDILNEPNAQNLDDPTLINLINDILSKLPPQLRDPPGDSIADILSKIPSYINLNRPVDEIIDQFSSKIKELSQSLEKVDNREIAGEVINNLKHSPSVPFDFLYLLKQMKNYLRDPNSVLDKKTLQDMLSEILSKLPNELRPNPNEPPGSSKYELIETISNLVGSNNLTPELWKEIKKKLSQSVPPATLDHYKILEAVLAGLESYSLLKDDELTEFVQEVNITYMKNPQENPLDESILIDIVKEILTKMAPELHQLGEFSENLKFIIEKLQTKSLTPTIWEQIRPKLRFIPSKPLILDNNTLELILKSFIYKLKSMIKPKPKPIIPKELEVYLRPILNALETNSVTPQMIDFVQKMVDDQRTPDGKSISPINQIILKTLLGTLTNKGGNDNDDDVVDLHLDELFREMETRSSNNPPLLALYRRIMPSLTNLQQTLEKPSRLNFRLAVKKDILRILLEISKKIAQFKGYESNLDAKIVNVIVEFLQESQTKLKDKLIQQLKPLIKTMKKPQVAAELEIQQGYAIKMMLLILNEYRSWLSSNEPKLLAEVFEDVLNKAKSIDPKIFDGDTQGMIQVLSRNRLK